MMFMHSSNDGGRCCLRLLLRVYCLCCFFNLPFVDSFLRQIPSTFRQVTTKSYYNPSPAFSAVRRSAVLLPWPWAENSDSNTATGKPPSNKNKNNERSANNNNNNNKYIHIGRNIGSGSYGTVHLCSFADINNDSNDNNTIMIAKRAWTEEELAAAGTPTTISSVTQPSRSSKNSPLNNVKERAKRCLHYLQVERDCYERMMMMQDSSNNFRTATTHPPPVPTYIGTFLDDIHHHEWIVVSFIGRHTTSSNSMEGDTSSDNQLQLPIPQQPAINLADAIYTDWIQQHREDSKSQLHHLAVLQRELGLIKRSEEDDSSSFEQTLDTLFISLFSAIAYIHQHNIVHCDIKPANILLDPKTSSLVILDFGSSVILGKKSMLLDWMDEEQQIIAISPMYAAPEGTFVRSSKNRAPCAFDVYSAGLIFCQLLFNLLDDRTDAAFHQQLRETNHDLDLWLSTKALSSKVRPSGLEAGLTYLSDRPGLWDILRGTLRADPEQRYTASEALRKFRHIINADVDKDTMQDADGAYFQSVISNLELCAFDVVEEGSAATATTSPTVLPSSRPLHFVATFDRTQSLGLILSEADTDSDHDEGDDNELWQSAIAARRGASSSGEVYVRGLVKGGQADNMGGIFEIGDRLVGIGEIPIYGGGFDKVVKMLSNQPRSAKTVTLHFDRISRSKTRASVKLKDKSSFVKVLDHGAWSSVGRRKVQEDTFVLQELHDGKGNDVLVAAVFDGHGGTAASQTALNIFPEIFSSQIYASVTEGGENYKLSQILGDIMGTSWEKTCNTYRIGCDEQTSCVADYDSIEGVVLASTGSSDLVAGTTAVAAALSTTANKDEDYVLHLMNCGDSRAVLAGRPREKTAAGTSFVHFSTKDHSPSCEIEAARLMKGVEAGLDYSLPQCSLSRWWLKIGDYQYAVSRSLEGSYATSKGIVSTPDISQIELRQVLAERENVSLVLASDGLFEVIDNEELSRDLDLLRESGYSAKDAAKSIVGQALKKGTSDNISLVVIYFA